MLLYSIISAVLLALSIMVTYKELERLIFPQKQSNYWIPALLWGLFYLSTQL
jgi:hypothetical protein